MCPIGDEANLDDRSSRVAEPNLVGVVQLGVDRDAMTVDKSPVAAPGVADIPVGVTLHDKRVAGGHLQVVIGIELQVGTWVASQGNW